MRQRWAGPPVPQAGYYPNQYPPPYSAHYTNQYSNQPPNQQRGPWGLQQHRSGTQSWPNAPPLPIFQPSVRYA